MYLGEFMERLQKASVCLHHKITWALVLIVFSWTVQGYGVQNKGETVILLHGIMNHPIMMGCIERGLKRQGYEVINWGYPSSRRTVQEHAQELHKIVKSIDHDQTIHFVGFSLGSIVIRYYLTHYPVNNINRFVMIAPPNHGSEMVNHLYPYKWFQWLYGTKSVWQLSTRDQRFFEECGIPPVEFGIIAGGRNDNEGHNSILLGDDDGTVCVESAKLEGSKDFIVLNHRHTLLLFAQETLDNVVSFLKAGTFQHSAQKVGSQS